MYANFIEAPVISAANDNNPPCGDNWECETDSIDMSDYMVKFTPEAAARLGLRSPMVSLGYLEYLMDGYVADEDEEASRRVTALMDRHAGPGWL